MKTIKFNYWTNLMRSGCKGNIGGNTSIKLDEQEEKLFLDSIKPAKEEHDILNYFKVHLSDSLFKRLKDSITKDFRFVMAKDALEICGKNAFSSDMTVTEYDSLSVNELIVRLIEETDFSDEEDYLIVDIEVQRS